MNSNEVRRGNYVEFEGNYYNIETIEEIYPALDTAAFGIGVVDWNNINGIPLSEEILLKCGFESNPYKDCYEYKNFVDVECDKTKGFTDLWIAKYPHIKNFHQLQNLYFALTNQELKVNL